MGFQQNLLSDQMAVETPEICEEKTPGEIQRIEDLEESGCSHQFLAPNVRFFRSWMEDPVPVGPVGFG